MASKLADKPVGTQASPVPRIVHLADWDATPPLSKALCGAVRDRPIDYSLEPSCVVCIDIWWNRP